MKTGNLKIHAVPDAQSAEQVKKTLVGRSGIRSATVRPGNPADAKVEFDEKKTTLEEIVTELRREGYDAEVQGFGASGR